MESDDLRVPVSDWQQNLEVHDSRQLTEMQMASAAAVAALPTFTWENPPVHVRVPEADVAGAEAAEARAACTGEEMGSQAGPCTNPAIGMMAACAICREDLENGCRVTSMPCGHLFHAPCLRPWLRQRHTCPMCRFQLPTQGTISELTDRVRPASSAPARPSGVRMRRAPAFRDDREANATGTDTAPMLSDGPGAPVLWTSRQRRPDSASNPATWPRRKLEGVLEAAGVSHQHCNDHSSLVEMVVMCLRDYYAAGAQYDRGRIRDLQASEVAGHQFRKPDTSADAERAHDDSGDLRDTSCACVLGALPCSHREPASRAGDVFHVCDRPTTSGHPNYLSSQRVGGAAGDRQGGESRCRKDEEARQRLGPLGGRGSRRELAAMAKGGRLEELSRSISMAGAAQATRTRCANIWRERLRDRDEELLHHTLYERERRRPRGRQRDTALEILEACVEADGRYYPSPPPPPPRVEGMPARPNVVTNGASSSFVVRRVGGSTTRNFQLVHGDFGWEQVEDPLQSSTDGTAGRAVNSGGLAHACAAGVWERESREGGGCGPGVSRRIVHCHVDARRDELGAVAAGLQDEGGRSRASMVLKVAAGKDRTLFE